MRLAFTVFLFLHAFAHLVGFLVPFGLAPAGAPGQPPPPRPDVLFGGSLVIGDVAARVLGVGWLALAVAFAVVAAGVFRGSAWWPAALAGVAVASLAMSAAFWPGARIGAWIDAILLFWLAMLLLAGRVRALA